MRQYLSGAPRPHGRMPTQVRPTVTLICPFAGTDAELRARARRSQRVGLEDGDELLIADNRPHPAPDLVDASAAPASSYFARHTGRAARHRRVAGVRRRRHASPSRGPPRRLLRRPAPPTTTAVLAGGIDDEVDEDTTVARYIAARRKLDQATTLAPPDGPYAQTANLAVRRAAFEAVGGWPDPVRSGGDADLCWRLAGRRLAASRSGPSARVAAPQPRPRARCSPAAPPRLGDGVARRALARAASRRPRRASWPAA